jgi:hypothetical protein
MMLIKLFLIILWIKFFKTHIFFIVFNGVSAVNKKIKLKYKGKQIGACNMKS